jgi:hypothetical protein
MRTVKRNPFLSGVCTVLGGALLWAGAVRADFTVTSSAAILVYPKLVLDGTSSFERTDTIIQITNTADEPVSVRCFYVNANGHCSNAPAVVCNPNGDPFESPCGLTGVCIAGWIETDFAFKLTAKQPIVWTLGDGLLELPLANRSGPRGEFNTGSIPPAPEDPMIGELKCIQVDNDNELPIHRNDLKGEATIETVYVGDNQDGRISVDSRGYNAIGIRSILDDGSLVGDDILVLDDQQYAACPNFLLLDHYFDDAIEPAAYDRVRTDVTFVPCSEDFRTQRPYSNTVQFLVYNEFEQRFSASKRVTCLTEIGLSDIDTRLGTFDDFASIFNVQVQGTLTGQTLMRSVAREDMTRGFGILAVAEEFHISGYGDSNGSSHVRSAAYTLQQRGRRSPPNGTGVQPDYIYLPTAGPVEPR